MLPGLNGAFKRFGKIIEFESRLIINCIIVFRDPLEVTWHT